MLSTLSTLRTATSSLRLSFNKMNHTIMSSWKENTHQKLKFLCSHKHVEDESLAVYKKVEEKMIATSITLMVGNPVSC